MTAYSFWMDVVVRQDHPLHGHSTKSLLEIQAKAALDDKGAGDVAPSVTPKDGGIL